MVSVRTRFAQLVAELRYAAGCAADLRRHPATRGTRKLRGTLSAANNKNKKRERGSLHLVTQLKLLFFSSTDVNKKFARFAAMCATRSRHISLLGF